VTLVGEHASSWTGHQRALRGTRYRAVRLPVAPWSPPVDLVAALAELGETDLPDPRSRDLSPPLVRRRSGWSMASAGRSPRAD